MGRPRAGHSKQAERGWDGQDERPEAAAPPLRTERTPRRGSPPAGSSGPLPPQVPQQPSPGGDCGQVQAAPAGLGGPGLRIASRLQAVPRPRAVAGVGADHALRSRLQPTAALRHGVGHASHTHLIIIVQTSSCSTPFRNKVLVLPTDGSCAETRMDTEPPSQSPCVQTRAPWRVGDPRAGLRA